MAFVPFVPYTTTGGETWAFIASKAYGDPTESKLITDANPTVPITYMLPPGLVLQIPINPDNANTVSKALLPPWKQ